MVCNVYIMYSYSFCMFYIYSFGSLYIILCYGLGEDRRYISIGLLLEFETWNFESTVGLDLKSKKAHHQLG